MRTTWVRVGGWLAAILLVSLCSGGARAQYRDNGIIFEGGVESYEFMPYTLAMFGTSQAIWEAWGLAAKNGAPARGRLGPAVIKPCSQMKPYGFPCQNNWFGLTDGVYVGLGYQRVLGDLLLDLSEYPIIKNLVFSYRGSLGVAGTLAGGGKMAPVFYTHQEPGIRWNILDENIRPYVAMNAGLNVFVDPVGFYGRLQSNNAACQRVQNGEAVDGSGWQGRGCVTGDPNSGAIGLQTFSPQAAAFYLTSFPAMGSLRPEVGIEWFFMEDVSVQFFGTANVYGTILPQFILRAPFLGFSARGGGSVVVYF